MSPMPFSERLATLRAATGKTQATVATDLDISLIHLSNLETGTGRPSHALVNRIAAYYAVDAAPLHELAGTTLPALEPDATLPIFLRTLRKAQGLSQQAVAEHLGVSASQISSIEIGRTLLPQSYAAPLANLLGVDADELLLRAGWLDCDALRTLAAAEPDIGAVMQSLPTLTRCQREQLVAAWAQIAADDGATRP